MWKITKLIKEDCRERKLQSNIITSTINKLLKSKILLDEDEEVINTYTELITVHNKDVRKRFENYNTFINNLCSKLNFVIDITMKDFLISAVCAVPHALMEIWSYSVWRQFRNYGKHMEDLIRLSNENLVLIVQVEKYFQERELFLSEYKSRVDNDELYNLLEAPDRKFKSHVVDRIFKTVLVLQKEIRSNTELHEKIIEMYDIISNTELNSLMSSPGDAFAECIKDMKYLYMLLLSNFWGSFILKLIFNISKCNEFYKVMDGSNKIREVLKANYEEIKNHYNNIRTVNYSNQKQDKKLRTASNRANVVRMKKIHEIQIFFKVGSDMAHTLENLITDNEKFELQVSFLIDHLKKSSVQINALEYIKPHSVMNQVVNNDAGDNIKHKWVEEERGNHEAKTIRYDEPESEGSDEEYECIVEDDEPRQVVSVDEYEDHVKRKSDYKQMMQELGTALAMVRERKAAKKGVPIAAPRTTIIKDSDDPLPAPRTKIQKVEIEPSTSQGIPEIKLEKANETKVQSEPKEIPIPPPPPPPMMSFTSELFFASQVAMEARKRNIVEEQFGYSGDKEDDKQDKDSLVATSSDLTES